MPVTRAELLELHEHVTDLAFRLMQGKNADYAATRDALYNLRQCEALGLCSVEAGILVRMTDKMSRLTRYTQTGVLAVEDEQIEDTVVDLVNYSVLLLAAIKDKREAKADNPQA
jgi:hypothetical protein